MIYIKENPVGIDILINDIQIAVSSALGWSNYNAYHRAYKNESASGIIPEVYKLPPQGVVGEYEEVFTNDNLSASSFFYTEDTISSIDVGRLFSTTLSMVFQCDLAELEGTDNRFDEEVHRKVVLAINESTDGKVESVITGISNVYTEFNTSQVQWTDMQPCHVFRVDISANYEYNCCIDCRYSTPVTGNEIVLF
jgi:hypothetical protein